MPEALVIGAGLAGLEAALTLVDQGLDVQILEASDRAGGVVGTWHTQGYRLEMSAHTVRAGGSVLAARLEEFNLPTRPLGRDVARRRSVLTDTGLHVFAGPRDLLRSSLLSVTAKARLLLEPLVPPARNPNETIDQFLTRRLGCQASHLFAPLCARGVYAGSPDRLLVRKAFPKLWAMDQSGGLLRGARRTKAQGILQVQGGMGRLPKAMAERLGTALHYEARVQSLSPCDEGWRVTLDSQVISAPAVIVATPARVASQLLSDAVPAVSAMLADLEEQRLQVVHLGYAQRRAPEGFGFLVHPNAGGALLGCLYASTMNADVAPPDACLLSCLVGATDDPIGEAKRGVAKALGWRDEPSLVQCWAPTDGLPVYGALHADLEQRVETALANHNGLALAGNYISGIGVDDTMRRGRQAAQSLLSDTRHRRVA